MVLLQYFRLLIWLSPLLSNHLSHSQHSDSNDLSRQFPTETRIISGVANTWTQKQLPSIRPTPFDDEDASENDLSSRLEILTDSLVATSYVITKRIDDMLNLTCHVVRDSGPTVKFQLEWLLPSSQNLNNR